MAKITKMKPHDISQPWGLANPNFLVEIEAIAAV